MVQISIDTERDSSATLTHLIRLLEEELRRRGTQPPTPQPFEPMRVPSHESPAPSRGSFTDMFGGSDIPQEKHVDTSEKSFSDGTENNLFSGVFGNDNEASPPAQDMFSVFNHDSPGSSSSTMYQGENSESYISSQMTQPGVDTPSASQLLDEEDIKDVTENLARDVWQKGSTRKPENKFNLEPY